MTSEVLWYGVSASEGDGAAVVVRGWASLGTEGSPAGAGAAGGGA